jgi:hypothetical protein
MAEVRDKVFVFPFGTEAYKWEGAWTDCEVLGGTCLHDTEHASGTEQSLVILLAGD